MGIGSAIIINLSLQGLREVKNSHPKSQIVPINSKAKSG
jgi:hypothetical protein